MSHLTGKVVIVSGPPAASADPSPRSAPPAGQGGRRRRQRRGHPGGGRRNPAAGGQCIRQVVDVTDLAQFKAAAQAAIDQFGAIDVLVNNAGVMPLAYFADHESAWQRWHQAIDINIKGVVNGIAAVYDQMIAQGRGHVVNISSIYGNGGIAGAGVYSATKMAVAMSDALRVETQGRIKVTTVKPTGVLGTNLGSGIVNLGDHRTGRPARGPTDREHRNFATGALRRTDRRRLGAVPAHHA